MDDVRDIIFKNILEKKFKAFLTPERDGCLSGVEDSYKQAKEIGVELELFYKEGDSIENGKPIGTVIATPKMMAVAEEKIIGTLSKFSGIATAARKAVELAEGKIRITAGSWKKMPPAIKDGVRTAVVSGGATFRITDNNMIYLDKNYIKMLGSIPKVLETVKDIKDSMKVVQIKGCDISIEEETRQALENGCGLLMVDTGNIDDLNRCLAVVNELGVRKQVEIAFASGVKFENIKELACIDIDVLCIGKEIVDAQLLDMKLDVI